MSTTKSRLRADVALVERGLVDSRAKAQALIMAGKVFQGEARVAKPGQPVKPDAPLDVRGRDHPWVSRGGLKLAHGLARFGLDPNGLTTIDVGASTGGFTDVLLTHGAARVYAVDVGRGQLAWKLQTDPRVVVLDRTNARNLSSEHISDPVDAVVCDASFIGLKTVLPAALSMVRTGGWAVALIKPQFEVGRDRLGKGGVVRDVTLHDEVCDEIGAWLEGLDGWSVIGLSESPITGPEGNREFLIAARYNRA